jgi:hypothetical protein
MNALEIYRLFEEAHLYERFERKYGFTARGILDAPDEEYNEKAPLMVATCHDFLFEQTTLTWLKHPKSVVLYAKCDNQEYLDTLNQIVRIVATIETTEPVSVRKRRRQERNKPNPKWYTSRWTMGVDVYMECVERFNVWPVIMPKEWMKEVRERLDYCLLPDLISIVLLYLPQDKESVKACI